MLLRLGRDSQQLKIAAYSTTSFSQLINIFSRRRYTDDEEALLPNTVAVFGGGDGAALLSTASWLASCRLFYWGDLDCHGFETLAHLRRTFSSIKSVLMDSHTFDEYSLFAVATAKSRAKEQLELTCDEHALYSRLAEGGVLLEQERIPFLFSKRRLLDAIPG